MIHPLPVTLGGHGIRLEPLETTHADSLARAASDGALWNLWFTSVPEPAGMSAYIADALAGQTAGHMLPWVVREPASGEIVGSTRYHDIVAPLDRVEIGYTWYSGSRQRTNVNTTCKLLLLQHAFETLGCKVVGLRTDNFNFRSQRAIEALGWRPRLSCAEAVAWSAQWYSDRDRGGEARRLCEAQIETYEALG